MLIYRELKPHLLVKRRQAGGGGSRGSQYKEAGERGRRRRQEKESGKGGRRRSQEKQSGEGGRGQRGSGLMGTYWRQEEIGGLWPDINCLLTPDQCTT